MTTFDWRHFADVVAPFLVRLDSSLERDTELEAAGLESLTLVELVTEIEDRWGVEFPADTLHWDTFATAGSLYETTASLVGTDG